MRGTREKETEKMGRRKNRRQDCGRGKVEEDERKSAEEYEGEQEDKATETSGRRRKMRAGGQGAGSGGGWWGLPSELYLADRQIYLYFCIQFGWGGGGEGEGGKKLEILFSVVRWSVSIHWASIPLVKLMVVRTSRAVLCPRGWGSGGRALPQLGTAEKPAGRHKVQV